MTSPVSTPAVVAFDAADIARWLEAHPEFFDEHAEIFADLKVPHPHTGRAISLGERQVLSLRERLHVLERRMNMLMQTARTNQQIAMQLHEWSLGLLSETEPGALPERVRHGLKAVFNVDDVALRLWDCPGLPGPNQPEDVDEETRLFADSLDRPYCGRDTQFRAVQWLNTVPASLAMVTLRTPQRGQAFGLLVLGADDASRFTADMGTLFLEQVGALAGAALSRLLAPAGLS